MNKIIYSTSAAIAAAAIGLGAAACGGHSTSYNQGYNFGKGEMQSASPRVGAAQEGAQGWCTDWNNAYASYNSGYQTGSDWIAGCVAAVQQALPGS